MIRQCIAICVGLLCATGLIDASGLPADSASNEFTFSGGVVNPTHGSLPAVADNAVQGSAGYYRRFFPWLHGGLEAGFLAGSEFEQAFPEGEVPDIDHDGIPDPLRWNSSLFSFTFSLTPQIRLGPQIRAGSVRWMPYAAAGGGLYWTVYTPGTFQITGITSSGQVLTSSPYSSSGRSSAHGGFNVGPGFQVFFSNGWGVGAEARYHQILYRQSRDAAYWIPALRVSREF